MSDRPTIKYGGHVVNMSDVGTKVKIEVKSVIGILKEMRQVRVL